MERQLLFLLDYDLRMEESELLEHFRPFMRQPTASTSAAGGAMPMYTRRPSLAGRPNLPPTPQETPASLYPSTPRRGSLAHVKSSGMVTPSPSPTRRGSQQPTTTPPHYGAHPYAYSQQYATPPHQRVSPGELVEDFGSDSSLDEMELDTRRVAYRRSSSATTISPTSQARRVAGAYSRRPSAAPMEGHKAAAGVRISSSGSSSSTSSAESNRQGPVTPTDDMPASMIGTTSHVYAGYATPGSASPSRVASIAAQDAMPLRTQRSGSFLRMTFEAGKGMLSHGLGHHRTGKSAGPKDHTMVRDADMDVRVLS